MFFFRPLRMDTAEYAVLLAVILALVVGTVRLIGANANNGVLRYRQFQHGLTTLHFCAFQRLKLSSFLELSFLPRLRFALPLASQNS